jgi:hypothetical protein
MQGKLCWNFAELLGAVREETYAERQNDGFRMKAFTVLQGHVEATPVATDGSRITSVDVRNNLSLEPFPIGNEILDRHRFGRMAPRGFPVPFER